jgi:ABC-type phosphate/phosphonate transport system substrate-binding protein
VDSKIRFGITASVIEADVNPNDALAATRVWADLMGKGTGLWNKSDARIFPDTASVVAAVNAGEADVVALGTQEYLEVEHVLHAIPSFTYVLAGQTDSQYLVLVRNDSGIKTLSDLRNRRLAIPKGGRNTMLPMWLDVLLFENNLGDKDTFFREIKEVQKPSQAILPIFFKQMEAGIVIKSSYETAVALNPQIGQQLKVLAASPKFVMMVTCMRSTLSAEQRDTYTRQALRLHETPSGLQAFNIFKLDRLVIWDPSYANNVRELLRKRNLARTSSGLLANTEPRGEARAQK